jgi:Ribbon-helix-helix protein, copG family
MRRTTILLDDDLAEQLDYERRRRNQSTTAIVREALTEYLAGGRGGVKRPGFIAIGRSGQRDTAGNADTILAREWTVERLTGRPAEKKPAARSRRRS